MRRWRWLVVPAAVLLLLLHQAGAAVQAPVLHTASGSITMLGQNADGEVWAATRGGVLRWMADATDPARWTTADGLVSNDVLCLALPGHGAWVGNAHSLQRIEPTGEVRDLSALVRDREVRSLAATPHNCWVGTNDGVFFLGDTLERKWTGSVRRIAVLNGACYAVTQKELVRIADNRRWPLPDTEGNITVCFAAAGKLVLATTLDLHFFDGAAWSFLPLPPESTGSHVSAVAVAGDLVTVAMFGDGLYELRGGTDRWVRLPNLPAPLQETTALLATPDGLLAGGRTDGVWRRQGEGWTALPMPPALPSADIYAVASFRAAMWASTFDHGLLCYAGGTWRRLTTADGLSTDAPRDLVVFRDALYVRHTTGEVDRFDGARWQPAFTKAQLPRPGVYSLATDGTRLFVGVWAGWAATDGKAWEYHFKEPLLARQVVTAIAPFGGAVWVGTQKAGLIAFRGHAVSQYHEAHGLTDDWITRLSAAEGRLLVGTYTGGLLEWTGAGFAPRMTPQGFAIRDIVVPRGGGAIVATPLGVYREDGTAWRLVPPARYGGLETQTLCLVPGGLWVGSRAALARLPLEAVRE